MTRLARYNGKQFEDDLPYQSFYHPCDLGLHVCGITNDGSQPYTYANFFCKSFDEAFCLFYRMRYFKEPDISTADFVVELFSEGEIKDDFPITRQMLERFIREEKTK